MNTDTLADRINYADHWLREGKLLTSKDVNHKEREELNWAISGLEHMMEKMEEWQERLLESEIKEHDDREAFVNNYAAIFDIRKDAEKVYDNILNCTAEEARKHYFEGLKNKVKAVITYPINNKRAGELATIADKHIELSKHMKTVRSRADAIEELKQEQVQDARWYEYDEAEAYELLKSEVGDSDAIQEIIDRPEILYGATIQALEEKYI